MRSVSQTTRYPEPIHSRAVKRAKELGYENVSEYLVGLALYDLAVNKPHNMTAGFARLTRTQQDKIVDAITEAYDKVESSGGSWLTHQLEEAVKQFAAGASPEEGKLMKKLLEKIGRNS